MNPYDPSPSPSHRGSGAGSEHEVGPRHWPTFAVEAFCVYYTASILTLPFANLLWCGEVPVLAIVQIPKAALKSILQDVLISLLPSFGLASGSASPDLIMTHPWALGLALTMPGFFLLCLILFLRRVAQRRMLVITVAGVTVADAAVTAWFDATSRLSIF